MSVQFAVPIFKDDRTMQITCCRIAFAIVLLFAPGVTAPCAENDSTHKQWFIGSTFLMLGNFIPDDPNRPDFIQLNVGYRITPKDAVFLELKTSKFNWPLGMPWSEIVDEDRAQYNFPGYVRQYILGVAYNRFWWKGLFTGIHAMNAFQTYRDENAKAMNHAYTLFMTYRLGYQLQLFDNLFFFEPSIGFTHWPIKTNTPQVFLEKEKLWPGYFAWEPGLHFGFNF
ncbi:MAG TPA: hypothetical protein PLW14_08225 [Chlorobiota bacterium]|nr:hypothetical protein [Chlorobiota bacterium]